MFFFRSRKKDLGKVMRIFLRSTVPLAKYLVRVCILILFYDEKAIISDYYHFVSFIVYVRKLNFMVAPIAKEHETQISLQLGLP
jgi:hypothetical protein